MLTVPEAAVRIHRDPETVRRWIRSGRLRSRRIGTQHLIEERDLAAFEESPRVKLPAAWCRTVTGEPMPDVCASLGRSRAAH